MATAASGAVSEAVYYARVTLADCATWRTWVGAQNQAQSLTRIFHLELPPPVDGNAYTQDELRRYHPHALVWQERDGGFLFDAIAQGAIRTGGTVIMTLADAVAEDLSDKTAELTMRFQNKAGAIAAEIMALALTAGYLAVSSVQVQGPWITPREQRYAAVETIWAELRLAWGLSA